MAPAVTLFQGWIIRDEARSSIGDHEEGFFFFAVSGNRDYGPALGECRAPLTQSIERIFAPMLQ